MAVNVLRMNGATSLRPLYLRGIQAHNFILPFTGIKTLVSYS